MRNYVGVGLLLAIAVLKTCHSQAGPAVEGPPGMALHSVFVRLACVLSCVRHVTIASFSRACIHEVACACECRRLWDAMVIGRLATVSFQTLMANCLPGGCTRGN